MTIATMLFAMGILWCQITIDNSTFPTVNDVLIIAADNLPANTSVPRAGENQNWQLGNLQAPFARRISFRDAQEGQGFQFFRDADLVASLGENLEGYYRVSERAFVFLGTFGTDPLNFGVSIPIRYNPGLVDKKAPVNFGDSYQSSASVIAPFSADDLPQVILDELPILPDSLRFRIETTRESTIDGWGNLRIPGGVFPVLRENRQETRKLRLDAKVSFLPWVDITDLIPGNEQLGDLITNTINFISNEAKEPIAVLYLNQNASRILRIEFKGDDLTTNVQQKSSVRPGVYAYPNPAIVNVRFDFKGLNPGNYQVALYDILANEVWSANYQINGDLTKRADIGHLPKGTYFYRLINSSGQTLGTKRLVVLRP